MPLGSALATFWGRKLKDLSPWWALRGFLGVLPQQALQ